MTALDLAPVLDRTPGTDHTSWFAPEPPFGGRTGIDIAVGILMVRCGHNRAAASRELIRRARTSGRGLGATAADIIAEAERSAAG